jgi:hypothetical protein
MGEPSLHGFKAESGTGELKMGSLGEGGQNFAGENLAAFAATRSYRSNHSLNILISI